MLVFNTKKLTSWDPLEGKHSLTLSEPVNIEVHCINSGYLLIVGEALWFITFIPLCLIFAQFSYFIQRTVFSRWDFSLFSNNKWRAIHIWRCSTKTEKTRTHDDVPMWINLSTPLGLKLCLAQWEFINTKTDMSADFSSESKRPPNRSQENSSSIKQMFLLGKKLHTNAWKWIHGCFGWSWRWDSKWKPCFMFLWNALVLVWRDASVSRGWWGPYKPPLEEIDLFISTTQRFLWNTPVHLEWMRTVY